MIQTPSSIKIATTRTRVASTILSGSQDGVNRWRGGWRRYQATKSSHHEINKAFEGRNYKPRRKYCSAKIKQFAQGFALLFIKQ